MPSMSKPIAGHLADHAEEDVRPPKFGSWNSSDRIGWSSLDDDDVTYCCLPTGCSRYIEDPISLADPGDAVKVVCNNDKCEEGEWMHADCFEDWEEHILNFLKSCGRARSWNCKQRHQNLWTRKGYDLAFKVCDCKCGRGHLRCDLNYTPTIQRSDEERRQKKARRRDRLPAMGCGPLNGSSYSAGQDGRSPVRIHRTSCSSTGSGSWSSSSPPGSLGTTPVTSPGQFMPTRKDSSGSATFPFYEYFSDPEQAIIGNIFRHRTDLKAFHCLPHRRQNTYQIKTEDEGPHGNDEIRCQVLTSLSAIRATTVNCVLCQCRMTVFDKYPLVDGTFFLSPVCYPGTPQDLVVNDYRHKGNPLHLNAICMHCLAGRKSMLVCRACRTPWSGAALVIGTMYFYDVFAAAPCCATRLSCNRCRQALCDPACGLKYFSDYSRVFRCPSCNTEDCHFVKPLDNIFVKVVRN